MIRIENLTKDYGSVKAVDRINFSVEEGEIVGFLGPNGAGKSTTLKILTCYLSPTEGNINVDNFNIYDHATKIKELIGYLPENNPLYTDMTVYAYLKFIGELRGLDQKTFNKNLRNVIGKCGLTGVVSKPINTLSKGYRQRVGIAQAILHDPKILILDEPTSGLDPNQIIEIRELIKDLGKEKTLILSSHILQEVQAVCNRIVIINKGNIVADGSMQDLKSKFQGMVKLHLELIADNFDGKMMTAALPGIKIEAVTAMEEGISVTLEYSKELDMRADIFNYIKSNDWVLLEMHRDYMTLEDLFITLTSEKGVA